MSEEVDIYKYEFKLEPLIKPARLGIARHKITGKKYFFRTEKTGHKFERYFGSGTYWINHLKHYGDDEVEKLWVSEFFYDTTITKFAMRFSRFNRIVESNDWANLVPEDGLRGGCNNHSSVMERYKELGLSGKELFFGRKITPEEEYEYCSKGGRISGAMNRESGHIQRIQSELDMSVIGKLGAAACKEKQVNAFFDPSLRFEICSKGGSTQGKVNAESGHLKRISNEYWDKVKSGEIARRKRKWATNGEENIMVYEDEEVPEGFEIGRIIKKK